MRRRQRMAEALHIDKNASKDRVYEDLLPQIESLIAGEDDLVANLANVAAVLKQAFDHLWIGFYIRKGDHLVLGPFQGPLACTRIPLKPVARGVCGAAAEALKTIIVDDVNQFAGHIACSKDSKSEIVVPLVQNGVTELVLDIDSRNKAAFDDIDALYLEKIVQIVGKRHC